MSESVPDQPARPSTGSVTAHLKVPPHSVEAEQSVLGGLMLNNDAWFNVAEVIAAHDFYRVQHQIIFEAMASLGNEMQPLDVVTLAEALQSRGLLDKAGGAGYLAELAENTPGASNVVAYARIVRERSTLRQLIVAANKIAEAAFQPQGRPSTDILDMAESEVFRIHEGRLRDSGPVAMQPLLARAVKRLEALYVSKSRITGVATGFDDLDQKTAGLQAADLIIVAGRPSMGKTSLALNMVEHALMSGEKGSVLVFSLEMPADLLIMRMISSLARIDQSRMRTGDMKDDDWTRFTSAVSMLKDKPLYVDDSPMLSPNELRTRARRIARETGTLRMIVVDYLQLMRPNRELDNNRVGEISEISRSLKAIAKEMSCPLIACAQLNRGLESRGDKRPQMSDLRDCVTGDTLVTLQDGRRVPIVELVGTSPDVLAMAEDQRIVRAQAEKVWKVGRREVFKLSLASGRTLTATAKHRIYSERGWMTVADAKPGDRLGVARCLPSPVATITRTRAFPPRAAAAVEFSSRSTLLAYAEVLDDPECPKGVRPLWDSLTQRPESDLFWDHLIAVEPAGEADVFDLTVPGPASWLADGIVCHNSGAIEQDADVILFIYRDEVYNKASTDKGTAEVIIGKQRNGPIGFVKLAFINNLTKFESLAPDAYTQYGD